MKRLAKIDIHSRNLTRSERKSPLFLSQDPSTWIAIEVSLEDNKGEVYSIVGHVDTQYDIGTVLATIKELFLADPLHDFFREDTE